MKFLSSSASSTISNTTSSFGGNDGNSSKNGTAGCIGGVFRRLLCLNSLPTYPSDDHFVSETQLENNSLEFHIKDAEVKNIMEGSAGTPNIVARLMGLESLPQIHLLNEQKGSSCSEISRSRSMNYVDTVLKELEYSNQGKKHRRVRSFRETPTFLDLEDENFLILSFENGAERMNLATNGNKPASEKIKNKRREQSSVGCGKDKENQDARNVSDEEELENLMTDHRTRSSGTHVTSDHHHHHDSMLKDSTHNILRSNNCPRNSLAASDSDQAMFFKPAIHRRGRDHRSSTRRTKKSKDEFLPVKKHKTETADDDNSENSSPNSVLDNITDFPCDPEDTVSGGVSRLRNSKTRRTLTEELENYRKLNKQNTAGLKSKTAAGKCVQLRRSTGNDQRYLGISRIADKEAMESSWVKLGEDEEIISTELVLKILDQLVTELVVDLSTPAPTPQFFLKNFDI